MESNIQLERLIKFTIHSCVPCFLLRVFSPVQLSVLEFTNCKVINNVINHVQAMVITLGHISCTEMKTVCSILLPNFREWYVLFLVTLIFSWFHVLYICINPKHIRTSFSHYFQSNIISEQN